MEKDAETEAIDRDILALIREGMRPSADDSPFNALALRLFAYQFRRNGVYGRFSQGRGKTPETVGRWQDVPAVPALAFKELPLTCFPIEQAVAMYMSSGTTGTKRSQHYLDTLELYEASLMAGFKACMLPDAGEMRMFVLMPPPAVLPNSSLGHMLEVVSQRLGAPGSAFYIDDTGLRADALARDLSEAGSSGQPIALLGTAFSFVHFLDYCAECGLTFALPAGSRIMDTGGFKGRSREVTKEELFNLYATRFGIPLDHVVNEYGMSEMGSQFYDNCLFDAFQGTRGLGIGMGAGQGGLRHKVGPPWVRSLIVDPETLEPLRGGQQGILRHVDLVNRGSVMAIQTEDLAMPVGEGFEVLGRSAGAEARGCSIAIDEMLSQRA